MNYSYFRNFLQTSGIIIQFLHLSNENSAFCVSLLHATFYLFPPSFFSAHFTFSSSSCPSFAPPAPPPRPVLAPMTRRLWIKIVSRAPLKESQRRAIVSRCMCASDVVHSRPCKCIAADVPRVNSRRSRVTCRLAMTDVCPRGLPAIWSTISLLTAFASSQLFMPYARPRNIIFDFYSKHDIINVKLFKEWGSECLATFRAKNSTNFNEFK